MSNINTITAHPTSILIVTVLLEYQISDIIHQQPKNPTKSIPHYPPPIFLAGSKQASKSTSLQSPSRTNHNKTDTPLPSGREQLLIISISPTHPLRLSVNLTLSKVTLLRRRRRGTCISARATEYVRFWDCEAAAAGCPRGASGVGCDGTIAMTAVVLAPPGRGNIRIRR